MENPKEQIEQRVNFTVEPPNPNPHDNANSFNHFQPFDNGYPLNHSIPRPLRKRPWHHSNQGTSPDQMDGAFHVKVYVAPVPRTATETDIRSVFNEHGTIVEVVLLKDKRTGARQGSCFVKYATLDEADRAIKALNNQYTFPGESFPVVVRFADRELERLGVRRNMEKKDPLEEVADKVFVSSINKEASKMEIEEIFSAYGHVEDIYLLQTRGYAFVKFSNREMALAAIKGLNRSFTMRGCNQPLIVRSADPKKPKTGDSRGNYIPVNANFGPCSQEPAVWPLPNFGDSNNGGNILPIAPHHSTIAHPQVTSHMQNWEPGANVVQQTFPPQQVYSQAPKLSSQPFITEVQRQSHPADSSVQNIEQQLCSQMSQFIILPRCLLRLGATLVQLLPIPHLICLQVLKMKCIQIVTGVNTTAPMVKSTTTTMSLVKANGRSLRSMPCTKNCRNSGSRGIIAVVSQNCHPPLNKLLKENRKQIMTSRSQKKVLVLDRCDVIVLGQLKSRLFSYYYDKLQIATK